MEPFLHLADHGKDSALSTQVDDMLGAFWEGIASFILQPSAPLAEFATIVCSLLETGANRPQLMYVLWTFFWSGSGTLLLECVGSKAVHQQPIDSCCLEVADVLSRPAFHTSQGPVAWDRSIECASH